MDSEWDGTERRSGIPAKELRTRRRRLERSWERRAEPIAPADADPPDRTVDFVKGDHDEERQSRVDAILDQLRGSDDRNTKNLKASPRQRTTKANRRR
jgi:hypothetical protein